MCGTVAIGLLGGLIASKLLFRRRFRNGPRGPWGGWRRRRFEAADVPAPPIVKDTPQRLHELFAPLELNERQSEEAREAFADVAKALGASWSQWPGLGEALAAVAAEPFDKVRAQAALGQADKAALDALEHVHNILTPEQRDKLDELLLQKNDWR